MQYLYTDGELYHFMDTETYEQLPLNLIRVEDALPYIGREYERNDQFFKGEAFR